MRIPELVMRGLEPICVADPYDCGKAVQDKLPRGWMFLKHVIRERDSFGPVTSELFLKGPDGRTYSEFI